MMVAKSLVFSLASLDICCRQALKGDWFTTLDIPEDGSWGVLKCEREDIIYILDQASPTSNLKVFVNLGSSGYFDRLNPEGRLQALQRMHYVANTAQHPRAWFPDTWSQYVATNLVSIFAYPVSFGRERMIAYMMRSEGDVLFSAITSKDEPIVLESYRPDLSYYATAKNHYQDAASEVSTLLSKLAIPVRDGVFDLDEVAHGAVSAGLTYTTWLPRLSEQQRSFVNTPPDRSQKLRGPAGTGKTLAMVMKVLHECYRAQDEEKSVHVLYVTHSWGVAEQAQNILDELDERKISRQVDVFPLITLAQSHLDNGNIKVLGDDSFQGKEAQLHTLAVLVYKAVRGDWNAFASSCSQAFANRVKAVPGTADANRFLWDLMLEFACVIGANGILPGFNAEQRYRQIERRPWMMPLSNDAEKEFIFMLYSNFINDLIERDEMTTDQVINDYLNILSTFRWHSERQRSGYDMIFVDEFHLFNEQERTVFHHLTKNPNNPPIVFMAMDPRQSPAETYAEFAVPGLTLNGNGESERSLGNFENIDLKVVYRYTPQILKFLQLIDSYFPALDLGADWKVSVADVSAERDSGPKPKLTFLETEKIERESAIKDALILANKGKRVAVLCLDSISFEEYRSYVQSEHGNKFESIESRDDVESLRYKKRSIVLSQPHYVAGLQFDAVVIGGFKAIFRNYDPNQAYGLRRFLSDVYLGASRARDILHIYSSGNQADFPIAIQAAVQEEVIEVIK